LFSNNLVYLKIAHIRTAHAPVYWCCTASRAGPGASSIFSFGFIRMYQPKNVP
jgi:hypothetical protein